MSVPHSSTPWSTHKFSATTILDAQGFSIAEVSGRNEQSIATAAHIVRCVNADAEARKELPNVE